MTIYIYLCIYIYIHLHICIYIYLLQYSVRKESGTFNIFLKGPCEMCARCLTSHPDLVEVFVKNLGP